MKYRTTDEEQRLLTNANFAGLGETINQFALDFADQKREIQRLTKEVTPLKELAQVKIQLVKAEKERDTFRAMLEGMGVQELDDLATKDTTIAKHLGGFAQRMFLLAQG